MKDKRKGHSSKGEYINKTFSSRSNLSIVGIYFLEDQISHDSLYHHLFDDYISLALKSKKTGMRYLDKSFKVSLKCYQTFLDDRLHH